MADHRGSDVKLEPQVAVQESRQIYPYPTFIWEWKSVQAYPWSVQGHINVLEFTAFLNYVKLLAEDTAVHGHRFLHVFDSRVASCVIAKGRSSSRMLNRPCRCVASFLLACDLYVLSVWTISAWNHADAASRRIWHDDG